MYILRFPSPVCLVQIFLGVDWPEHTEMITSSDVVIFALQWTDRTNSSSQETPKRLRPGIHSPPPPKREKPEQEKERKEP